MALLRCKITIPRDTALPEDVSVNTLHFSTTEGFPYTTARTDIAGALNTCYAAFDQLLSAVLAPPGSMRFYDMGDPEPRVPLGDHALALTVDTTTTSLFPEECAIVASFSAAAVSGENRARRRGRIYLGPIAPSSVLTSGRVRVPAGSITAIASGMGSLLAASIASPTWTWVVYSPTYAAENADFEDRYAPVVRGFIDDAFDTQRRRGPAPTTRVLWGAP